jgi:multiple sugar transport system substrate-binding protein
MSRKIITVIAALLVSVFFMSACQSVVSAPAVEVVEPTEPVLTESLQDRTPVYWFIGLGGGSQPDQIVLEEEFVRKYNASQDEIQLLPIIVDNTYALDNLKAQMEIGNAIDIVGPVGTSGRSAFPGAFLDLEPLIESTGYDTSDIDPAFFDFYKEEGALVGLPFAIFPEAVFYNKALFDAAGLAYPPQQYGAPYVWADGTQEEWNFDTLSKVARLLTLDSQGNNASSPQFNADAIVQYGYLPQWTDNPRAIGTLFGPSLPMGAAGHAAISDNWKAAWTWYYDGIFGAQPFIPGQAAIDDEDVLNENPFSSGKVAMATTHLWYTCCIDTAAVPSWDVAVMPSYNGVVTSKMHGDTFAIMKTSENPEAAFKVYTYMLGEGSEELYAIYGGLPARTSQQEAFFAALDQKFAPNTVNWQVFLDSISYMDIPNHEAYVPNFSKVAEAFQALGSDFRIDNTLNLDRRFAQFLAELNAIYQGSGE